MYSIYNRSIPISFQNTLYCGTESKQVNTEQTQEIKNVSENHNCFYIALVLLFLFDYISLP